jgi:saccharopine dehydrogenase (NAD+, L-lysine forming)
LAAYPQHRLQTVVDVSCDPSSPYNPLPFYADETTLKEPALVQAGLPDVVAVSHLPSLLPLEASQHFSDLLTPHLLNLKEEGKRDVWERAAAVYDRVLAEAKF